MESLTKRDELKARFLSDIVEHIFEEKNNVKLIYEVDLFNEHIIWSVSRTENDYTCYREFNDFYTACDYYLEAMNEAN